MANIKSSIEVWKNKLLDLSRGNRLVNLREATRSVVKITSPSHERLFDLIVRKESAIEFPLPIEEELLSGDGQLNLFLMDSAISSTMEKSKMANNSIIQTDKTIVDLQKALRNLRNKSRTAMEEQGVNMLYLCFGFLKWTQSDTSEIYNNSPLILVPVKLSIESLTSPFVMSLHEDEIVVNPTLTYRMSSEYGIVLPAFDENTPLDQYFNEVRSVVKNMTNWEVTTDVCLGMLSFQKINMYNDLVNHSDEIENNGIVKALCGDPSDLTFYSGDVEERDLDKIVNPLNVYQILDADASQQEAIAMAKKGASFVLQGPPGSGKSQTIANIIAECMASGKKVLFVSEKAAALDVVYNRLTQAGLADFCFVLHSHKANKRSVLDQLEKVLYLSGKKAKLSDEAYHKLDTLVHDRDKLNAYSKELHTVIEPLGKTIYEANGVIANLDQFPDIIFTVKNIRRTTADDYNTYIYLLSCYAKAIANMTVFYAENPWRGSKLTSVTNEYRHDINANLTTIVDEIKTKLSDITATFQMTRHDTPITISEIKKVIGLLSLLQDGYEVPVTWVIEDKDPSISAEIEEYKVKAERYNSLIAEVMSILKRLRSRDIDISLDNDSVTNVDVISSVIDTLKKLIESDHCMSSWAEADLNSIVELFNQAKQRSEELENVKHSILESYAPEIFDINYRDILARYKTEYTSFIKHLKKTYKEDRKAFMLLSKSIGRKITDEEILHVLCLLQDRDEKMIWFNENFPVLQKYFNFGTPSESIDFAHIETDMELYKDCVRAIQLLSAINSMNNEFYRSKSHLVKRYESLVQNGMLTDWNNISSAYAWACDFREKIANKDLDHEFISQICTSREYQSSCVSAKERLEAFINNVEPLIIWFSCDFDKSIDFMSMDINKLCSMLTKCLHGLTALEEWVDFNAVRMECIDGGLEEFIICCENICLKQDDIIPAFKKRFYRLWLDSVLPEFPAVLSFRQRLQEETIEEFSTLDKLQLEIAKARIQEKLINSLPSTDRFTNGYDEISILKREMAKQRKLMPTRKLFTAIPNLIMTLKPCLMMSPLSVSLFLESEFYKFDMVIFDEASQVNTENAIGAIVRGKQVVIAGDSKQLPPTNFFQASLNEGDYDTDSEDEEDTFAFDSILDEATSLPERTLRWHYRSRHEGLIAFSNAKFYKNKLITFPSNIESGKDVGVEYIKVDGGYYDRGGRKGNQIEAKKVASLVFEHFKNHPNRSLGVITFGEIQQLAVENELRSMRLADQSYEDFFREDIEEPFFIKSLENVQGDERDTIIFSIGYAPDKNGVFRMNFGPLGQSGGEKRLNVAITRAKYNTKLVGSIRPDDINVDAITTDGPKLLRAYIDYAINGPDVLDTVIEDSDIVEYDSPFEEAVYNFLDRRGYKLATQVGCSGYRIDIGVKHPSVSGVFVMGIECDGAMYHSARTARDRDRLRQDVLEGMGWKIYRIWSTDWIKDPATQGLKLIEEINAAIKSYDISKIEKNTVDRVLSLEETSEPKKEDFIQIEKKQKSYKEILNPYGFDENKPTSFSSLPRDRYGYLQLSDCLSLLIEKEYPVHYDILCQRVAPLLGNEKATVKIRREVDYALNKIENWYVRKGDFFFPVSYNTIPIRLPNKRKIQHIHVEELASAMYRILQKMLGADRKSLADETCRVYGFARSGQNITVAMNNAINYLIDSGLIEEVEGKISIKK